MSTASPIQQSADYSAYHGHQPSAAYQIDFRAALTACQQAQICLQHNDLDKCERLAIDALKYRPSCDLAYRLLSQLYDKQGLVDDSVVCRQRCLPEWLHRKYFGHQDYPDHSDILSDGVERRTVFESEQLSVSAPRRLFDQLAPPFRRTRIESNAVFIDTVRNATLWHDSSNTLVFDGRGAKVVDHAVGNTQLLQALIQSSEPVVLRGRVILLGARGAHNYYHWLLDIIPKLSALQAAGFELSADDTLVVPHANPAFARALLAQCGVMPQQIFAAESVSPFLFAEQLVVPRLSNTMGYSMGSWITGALQQSILQHSPLDLKSDLKIYVSRDAKAAAGRTVGNQQEIEDFFSRCGFEIVFPERCSVVEQASLFAKASVVAGPHGAGLSNLVYCAPGTKVIEFFGEHMAPCYWLISALAGLEYYQHYCVDENDADRRSAAIDSRAAGFAISVRSAESLLRRASVI